MSGPGKAHGSQKNGDSIYFHDPDKHMLEIICYEAQVNSGAQLEAS
jgi:hypothetical protein